jgi:hypothetical protein
MAKRAGCLNVRRLPQMGLSVGYTDDGRPRMENITAADTPSIRRPPE